MMLSIWKIMSSKTAAEPVFHVAGRAVPLAVIRSPLARRMTLRLDRKGSSVRLTLPTRAPLKPALLWAESKRGWIEAELAKLPAQAIFNLDTLIPFGDQMLRIDWDEHRPRRIALSGDTLITGGPAEGLEGRILRWLKAEAKRELTVQTGFYAARAGVSVSAVSIGDPVSRWGSCSASGAIRYSWRLILAPAFVLRATAAHEVAHRVHMNHGPDFHALVANILGEDPAPARRWLREHGLSLHRFGG